MAETDENGWYLFQAGERLGPFAGDELKRLAAVGRMKPDDYLWRQGEPRHYQVSEFPELRKRVRDYSDPTGYAPDNRTEVEVVDVQPPAPVVEMDRDYLEDTAKTSTVDPWAMFDQTEQSLSRQNSGSERNWESGSGNLTPAEMLEHANEAMRSLLGEGSIKVRTIVFLLLGIFIPLWPISTIIFWYLAYKSYND